MLSIKNYLFEITVKIFIFTLIFVIILYFLIIDTIKLQIKEQLIYLKQWPNVKNYFLLMQIQTLIRFKMRDCDLLANILLRQKIYHNFNSNYNQIKQKILVLQSLEKLFQYGKKYKLQTQIYSNLLKISTKINQSFRSNCIGDSGVIVLSEQLSKNSQIKHIELNLGQNHIYSKGIQKLGEYFSKCQKMKSINLFLIQLY
ncbi:transmembrane protein, putative (macronuclear) [Tetrahymena thermophila SB210]|uniref:Transmembrane protein, putative n=1 Tax=Tetrahymena thermophila (strain SB210) TaxID=312017 RepID=W7XIL8_TETTS|nr:transmembrane protein, putative [Tetrahymena thermophila SB210]EWS74756.1 transmembrane protein, putative [Tetrahymena thermophila SB210]|eukprot:XP_012652757.1 transmembrane protein, putative [Tetrahymena thermophila SB210]